MNRNELFQNLESWLQQEDLNYEADAAASAVTFMLAGSAGEWSCRIICEEEPSMLQIVCRLPVRVPKIKLSKAAMFLHRINQGLRIGSFSLSSEERNVWFRLAMPVRAEAPFESQIAEAFQGAMGAFDDTFSLLCAFLCDNEPTRRRLNKLNPDATAAMSPRLNSRGIRPELN